MRGKPNSELIVVLRELRVEFKDKPTARLAGAVLKGDVAEAENAIGDGGDVRGIGSCCIPWMPNREQIIPINYFAAHQNNPEIIDLLINAGVDMISPKNFCYLSSNVLTVALQSGYMNVVQRLINYASVAEAAQIIRVRKEHQTQYLEYRDAYIREVSELLLIEIPNGDLIKIVAEYLQIEIII